MTIFLTVLKLLIKNQLSVQISRLMLKTTSLAKDQKELLEALDEYVTKYASAHDDETDLNAILKKIEGDRGLIQKKRTQYGAPRDTGHTITCVTNLIFHTKDFYIKLNEFCLLNQFCYENTPLSIMYLHAAQYLGEEIFEPLKISDPKVREKKEAILKQRMELLLREMMGVIKMSKQIERTIEVIDILLTDNGKINGRVTETPSTSYFGIFAQVSQVVTQAVKDTLGLGSDRFKSHLEMSKSKILRLKEMQLAALSETESKTLPAPDSTIAPKKTLDSSIPVAMAASPSMMQRRFSESKHEQKEDASVNKQIKANSPTPPSIQLEAADLEEEDFSLEDFQRRIAANSAR